jgi:L-iditol 2-dehydrogenase
VKAARLFGRLDLRVEEIPVPVINDNEVLIKVKSAFICGTDVRMYKNGKMGIDFSHPVILGHEFAGIIEETGKNVRSYQKGMRVAVAPNYGCGVCSFCVSGNNQLCRNSNSIGVTVDGGFAEFVCIPENAVSQGNIALIDGALSFEAAALAEPLSCVYNAYEKIGIYPGDKVLIIGAGPIGIMHAKVARLAGASQIYLHDVNTERLLQCEKIDPNFIAVHTDSLKAEMMKRTQKRGVDLVITAASVPAVQEEAFTLAGINGRVMFFGGLPAGSSFVSLDTNEIHYKQLTVSGTTRQSIRQYRKVLGLLASGSLMVDDLVTSCSSVEHIHKVIEDVLAGKGFKISIRF